MYESIRLTIVQLDGGDLCITDVGSLSHGRIDTVQRWVASVIPILTIRTFCVATPRVNTTMLVLQ
ncbi:hypothetical protein PG995_005171 [Apiospora arundinis]